MRFDCGRVLFNRMWKGWVFFLIFVESIVKKFLKCFINIRIYFYRDLKFVIFFFFSSFFNIMIRIVAIVRFKLIYKYSICYGEYKRTQDWFQYRFKESLSSFPFQQLLVPESKFDILIEEWCKWRRRIA